MFARRETGWVKIAVLVEKIVDFVVVGWMKCLQDADKQRGVMDEISWPMSND